MNERRTAEARQFGQLTYDDFRVLAGDGSLSPHEKVGFPDAYRAGREDTILADVRAKLPALDADERLVVDIGCGCSTLTVLLATHCAAHRARLVLVDSTEMLAALPVGVPGRREAGRFPEMAALRTELDGRVDAVLVYSVLHYVFAGDLHGFLDAAVALLAPGGRLLVGDVPNVSRRTRFFSSAAGAAFHRQFMETDDPPTVRHGVLEPGQIDDGVLIGLLLRYRLAGYETYLVPQPPDLPMANRREDLLIVRN